MKLGYFWPDAGHGTAQQPRATFARALGFSEFAAPAHMPHTNHARFVTSRDPAPSAARHLRLVGGVRETQAPSGHDAPEAPVFGAAGDLGEIKDLSRAGLLPLSQASAGGELLSAHWAAHVEGCTHGGIRACPSDWRVARIILVDHDGARARAHALDPKGPGLSYLARQDATPLAPRARAALGEQVICAGTPDEVSAQLLALRARVGRFGTLVLIDLPWRDAAMAKRSLALMAQEVWPAITAQARLGQSQREMA